MANKTLKKRVLWGQIAFAVLLVLVLIGGMVVFGSSKLQNIEPVETVEVSDTTQDLSSDISDVSVPEEDTSSLLDSLSDVTSDGLTSDPTVSGLEVDADAEVLDDPHNIAWIDPSRPVVALTFDDGPGGDSGDRIYETLKENGAHATFFFNGQQLETRDPNRVTRLVDIGCEVANHTYHHKNLSKLSAERIKEEEQLVIDQLDQIVTQDSYLVRPPYGAQGKAVREALSAPVILWSVDTLDWKADTAQDVINELGTPRDGDIILMHEIHNVSASALEIFLPQMVADGYQFATVSELFAYKGIELEQGKYYCDARPHEETT